MVAIENYTANDYFIDIYNLYKKYNMAELNSTYLEMMKTNSKMSALLQNQQNQSDDIFKCMDSLAASVDEEDIKFMSAIALLFSQENVKNYFMEMSNLKFKFYKHKTDFAFSKILFTTLEKNDLFQKTKKIKKKNPLQDNMINIFEQITCESLIVIFSSVPGFINLTYETLEGKTVKASVKIVKPEKLTIKGPQGGYAYITGLLVVDDKNRQFELPLNLIKSFEEKINSEFLN